MKYFDFKRYKLSTILKKINFSRYNFLKDFNFVNFKKLDLKKNYKYISFLRSYLVKLLNYLNPRRYNYSIKKNNLIKSRFIIKHLPLTIIFFGFLYFSIPTLYKYEKKNIENLICENKNIKCTISGNINYNFLPTPRIKIKDLVVSNLNDKEIILLSAKKVILKLSLKNLIVKDKQKFKTIEINNYEINVNLKKLKNFSSIKFEKIPVKLLKGQITLLDNNVYVATIDEANLSLSLQEHPNKITLRGKFLGDDIYIRSLSKMTKQKLTTKIKLKMSNLNLLTKIKFFSSKKKNINGNVLIRKDKFRFTGIFDYKDNAIIISESNLRNIFLDGKLEGKIELSPYFNFNLDLNLNSINFTKLYSYLLNLSEKDQKNLFEVNNKINGNLNLSAEKVYSSYNLVKSLESRVKFSNGNILIDQFLINLGKLGAADISGDIKNNNKSSNFKYEGNFFIDNEKKFLSKFAIYNLKNISSNLFFSGNFDLKNIRNSFYEISNNEKLNNDDINFIEKEFNEYMLSDGYNNLFRFSKFKEFIKLILSDSN